MPTRCPQAACGTEPLKYGWSDPRCAVKYIPDFEDFVSEKGGAGRERMENSSGIFINTDYMLKC